MELIQEYLEKVQKIDGIWVLHVPDSLSMESLHHIHGDWTRMYPGEHLIIMPQEVSINKFNKYTFYIAMMLIRGGYRITRLKWTIESGSKKTAPYLILDNIDGKDVLIKKWPNEPEEDEFFLIEAEDMDADDYVVVAK